jgi:hypothetical protein
MAACDKEVRIETGHTPAMREILLKRFSSGLMHRQ